MSSGHMPWSKFFWDDWNSDPGLRLCSLAAQGLWMRMLCVCAKGEPNGYLTINGNPLGVDDIARLAGVSETEAGTLMAELDRNGVFSRDRKGRIYSRRMVRDAKRSNEGRKHVKKRWVQAHETKEEIPLPNRVPIRDPTTQKPEAICHKAAAADSQSPGSARHATAPPGRAAPGPDPGGGEAHDRLTEPALSLFRRVTEAMGVSASGHWRGELGVVKGWLRAGYDPDRHVMAAVRSVMDRGGQLPTSLKYFTPIIAETADEGHRLHRIRSRLPPRVLAPGDMSPEMWDRCVRLYRRGLDAFAAKSGEIPAHLRWPATAGPPPDDPAGFLGPPELLERYGFVAEVKKRA